MAPHLRDLLLGMAATPEVQGGEFEASGDDVDMGKELAEKLSTVPGIAMGDPVKCLAL